MAFPQNVYYAYCVLLSGEIIIILDGAVIIKLFSKFFSDVLEDCSA